MKRAFFIVGPQSSGTKLLARILIQAGCFGDDTDDQCLDSGFDKYAQQQTIVFRRSFPHSGRMESISNHCGAMGKSGYSVCVLVCCRDMHAMTQSQQKRGHCMNQEQAYAETREAYSRIFSNMPTPNYFMVSYESLTSGPRPYLGWLLGKICLDASKVDYGAIEDRNGKHYQ